MINITLSIDATRAERLIREAGRDFPFALSKAVNAVRNEAQENLHAMLLTRFTIAPSRLAFMSRLIKRTGNATKERPVASLGIVGPGGKGGRGRAGILARHVFGGVHRKADAINPFFIPADVLRPGAYDLPPRKLYPANIRLQDRKAIDGGTQFAKARLTSAGTLVVANTKRVRKDGQTGRGSTEKRSFFVIPKDNSLGRTPGIYERERTGPDKGDLQLLWLYKEKIDLKRPRLPFYDSVRHTVRTRWQPLVERELRDVIIKRFR